MTAKEIRLSIKTTIHNFVERDPRRDCWEFITTNHPDLWRDHQTALHEIDAGYQAKDAVRVLAAKNKALDTFNRMVEAWQQREQCVQQEIM